MGVYVRRLECLTCSNDRGFVHHTEAGLRPVSQAEAVALPPRATITCGRCGSMSLIRGWGDAIPYAAAGFVPRRRRRSAARVQEAQLQ
jgi:hypothetical protein